MDTPIITMLGTGNAMVTRCYNTCFTIKINDEYVLIDAGGGNGILAQIESANIDYNKIRNVFVTHNHTDHVLGVVWILRKIASLIISKKYEGTFNVYASKESIFLLKEICRACLKQKEINEFDTKIIFNEIIDGSCKKLCNIDFTFFDIHSTKKLQYGFRAVLPNDKILVCLGDEPYNEKCKDYVVPCDWLMCEAFCLFRDKDIFKPYEKHHSTAKDVGKLATSINVKNLIVYHTEDKNLNTRNVAYTKEVAENFNGNIFVPEDLESVFIA